MKCNEDGKECDFKILHGAADKAYSVCHLSVIYLKSYPSHDTMCTMAV